MIIDKVLMNNYPIFIFINKFNSSIGIIKEVYAEVIVILMKDKNKLTKEEASSDFFREEYDNEVESIGSINSLIIEPAKDIEI